MVPISVERTVHFKDELLSVASDNFLRTTFVLNNRTCVYGTCYYCTETDPVCEGSNHLLSGAAIFNIKGNMKVYRSPWKRIYRKNRLAEWQTNDSYCR